MYTEWLLRDSQTDRLKYCEAYNQKDAIRIALSYGIVPAETNDVRPRVERMKSDNRLMPPAEFQKFLESLRE